MQHDPREAFREALRAYVMIAVFIGLPLAGLLVLMW